MNPRDDLEEIFQHWDGRQAADWIWHYGGNVIELIDAAEDLRLWEPDRPGWDSALARLETAAGKLAMPRKDTPR